MKKNVLLLILALIGFAGIESAWADPIQLGSTGTYYEYDSATKTLTITGNGNMPDYNWNNTPWNGYLGQIETVVVGSGVTTLGNHSFYGCRKLKNVTLPSGLLRIGMRAFQDCEALKAISLPSSLNEIYYQAFIGCTGLESIIIPDKTHTMEEMIFRGCVNLKVVMLSSSLTIIDTGTFEGCTSLESITIPDRVKDIVGTAFSNCTSLTTITLKSEVPPRRNPQVFAGTNSITCIYVPFGSVEAYKAHPDWIAYKDIIKPDPTTTYYRYDTDTKTLTITATTPDFACSYEPPVLTSSAPWNDYKEDITNLVINDGVDSIGSAAFFGLTNLKYVTISNTVTHIGNNAFAYCRSLENIYLNKVMSLGLGVFQDCESLKKVYLTPGMTIVPEGLFHNCTSLKEIGIPNTISTISNGAFSNCSALNDVTLFSGLTTIEAFAFENCSGLKSLVFPSDIEAIGEKAFTGCNSLASVTIKGSTLPELGDNFIPMTTTIYVQCHLVSTYIEDVRLSAYKENVAPDPATKCYDVTFNSQGGTAIEKKTVAFLSKIQAPPAPEKPGYTFDGWYKDAACKNVWDFETEEIISNVTLYAKWNEVIVPVDVTGVLLDKETLLLKVDSVAQLTATVSPENADDMSVIWESSDINIATVSSTGLVTALAPGSASITVKTTDGEFTASCAVVVSANDIPEPIHNVTSVSIFPNKSVTIVAGGALQVTATVLPANATDKSLVWTSSNETVATVDSLGKITAKTAGSATITVTTNDGGKTASIEVSIFGIAVSSVALDKTADTIPIGSSVQLTATINPSYATDKTIKWTSSDEAVALVDSTGKVYGMAEGKAVITVETANGKTDSCTITVYRPINDVTIELPIGGGESITISLELPAGGFITGSFVLTLPAGMLIDIDNSSVTESLSENLELVITPLGNNTWLVELVAAVQTYSAQLRSSSTFREILNIAYKVDEKMASGTYEVSVSDVNMMLSDGTKIKKDKLSASVTISGTTSNDLVGAEKSKATLINSMLTVDTPDAETVNVYSVSGAMVYTTTKVEGKSVYSVPNLANGIYIVTGSKGWQTKVLKK